MKITKAQLRKIISEELDAYIRSENTLLTETSKNQVKRIIRKKIKKAVAAWLDPALSEDLKTYPAGVWLDLVNTIVSHWTTTARKVYGHGPYCPDTPECKKLDAVFAMMNADITPITNEIEELEGDINKWLVGRGNPYRLRVAVNKFMDYIPPGTEADLKKRSLERTTIWKKATVTGDL
tara:strand:- start:487 stop:1023 length:537 start_codon:yes stop_codon:yes gene_type:complete